MTITEQELRECPHCKSEVIVWVYGTGAPFEIKCLNQCINKSFSTREEAIKAWNTRAYDAELEELMQVKQKHEKLKKYIEERIMHCKALLDAGYWEAKVELKNLEELLK